VSFCNLKVFGYLAYWGVFDIDFDWLCLCQNDEFLKNLYGINFVYYQKCLFNKIFLINIYFLFVVVVVVVIVESIKKNF
jgi:hypothetical protein